MEIKLHSEFPIEMEKEWNALLAESATHVPFLRFEYINDWWSTRGGGEWPDDSRLAILTAREDSRLIGIAPFFISEHEGEMKLLLLGSIEISDFLDLICRSEDLERFTHSVIQYITQDLVKEIGIQKLDLYNILEDSPTLPALESAAQEADYKYSVKRLQHSPYIPLPGDWQKYLESLDKKQRHEIRRKMRRAEEGDQPASVYITSEAGKLEDDMDDFLDLMAQDEAKDEFLSPRMRKQLKLTMRCAFNYGCLQLAFLLIGGVKTAAYVSFDFLNRLWVYNSGVDKSYMSFSPGWVLLGHLLQWANDNGRDEFDFMRGNEDYKYKFGAIDRFVVKASIDL